jgi:alpha-ketoglutarate-dependent taurine dioxygenase
MLDRKISDARAWTAATIDEPSCWYYPASRMKSALQPVLDALELGRGFAILESSFHSAAEAIQLYRTVGEGLGKPFAQNIEGVMLYDVRDTGQDLSKGARFSVTSYESSFHTDNSFGDAVLDYVGLLCLQVAKSGGRSQIVSGYAVHNVMRAEYPSELATLYEPFHVDRRGGIPTGDSPTVEFPVFANRGDDLLVRYLRFWIEAGHEKVGRPLAVAQRRALNVLDQVLNRPELRVEFDLKPGDMYFINNRWTLHNRTAFEDFPEPERRRHLVRLWLQAACV